MQCYDAVGHLFFATYYNTGGKLHLVISTSYMVCVLVIILQKYGLLVCFRAKTTRFEYAVITTDRNRKHRVVGVQ